MLTRYLIGRPITSVSKTILKSRNELIINKSKTKLFSTVNDKRLRRVLFNTPGSDERKVLKATDLDLDCIVLDLEDGVAINQKENARSNISKTLRTQKFGRAEKCIRINAIGSGLESEDLEKCIKGVASEGLVDALVIPKVESGSHLNLVSKFLDSCGNGAKNVKILAAIESAKGLVDLREICKDQPRLEALIFASEDLAANMGLTRTENASELHHFRSRIVMFAVAYELQAIDMVCLDYKNANVVKKETEEARNLGYSGKQAIHPNQIAAIYEGFAPSEKHLKLATRIIEENKKFQAKGVGAFEIDGKMIDMPMVKWAQNIMSRVIFRQ